MPRQIVIWYGVISRWSLKRAGWRIVSFDFLKDPPFLMVALIYLFSIIVFCFYVSVTVVAGLHFFRDLLHGSSEEIGKSAVVFGSVLAIPGVLWTAYMALKQIEITRDNQRADLFVKSITQLSAARPNSDSAESSSSRPGFDARCGAIFGLQRVASDSMKYHWTVMELLSLYVRDNYPAHLCAQPDKDVTDLSKRPFRPSFDQEAAMTVIGRRPKWQIRLEADALAATNVEDKNQSDDLAAIDEVFRLRFDDTNFRGLTLSRCSFSRAMFRRCKMERIVFLKCDLSGAWFDDSVMTSAIFLECNLDRARFSNNDLSHCQMSNTTLEKTEFYGDVDISKGFFVGTKFENIVERVALDKRDAFIF